MNSSPLDSAPPPCRRFQSRDPSGAAVTGRVVFVEEKRGDPLGSFPSLRAEGLPYNLWLTGRILEPALDRWSREAPDSEELSAAVVDGVRAASLGSREAFRKVLPLASGLGDPAVVAAMGVTANLQRTLALLAEFILGNCRVSAGPSPCFPLSRLLCGLIDYPKDSPYFPGRVRAPAPAGALPPHRSDPRHLGNALWCSVGEIDRRCEQALDELRWELRGSRFAQENRSGGVRLRNSSM